MVELFYRSKLESDEVEFEFVEMLVTQAAIAIDNAAMYEKLKLHNISLEHSVQKATQELRQSKERVETILNNSPNAITLLTVDGTIEMTNQGFRDLFGYSFVDVRGKPISFVLDEQTLQGYRGALKDVVEQLETRGIEGIASREDGSKIEIAMSLSPVRGNGGLDGIVCTMSDITARNELQRMKDAFVSNVSHELRTPISAMRLNYSLLKKNPSETKYLDRFDREINRLNQMIEDLLRLSQLDQGQGELNMEPIDLNSLLVNIVEDRTALAASNELELVLIPPETRIPRAQADANLIKHVLSVLLMNAIHYTPAGGRIEVRAVQEERDGGNWSGFSVEDNGMGISSDDLPYIFERFYRGKAGREAGAPGTGLGLSIASEIVKRHEGRIDVESTGIPGEGTTFTVWLPALTDNSGSEKRG